MKILYRSEPDFDQRLAEMLRREAFNKEIDASAQAIIDDVKARGDDALVDYARKFDHVELTPATFRVTDAEIDAAIATLPPETTAAVDLAVEHIQDF